MKFYRKINDTSMTFPTNLRVTVTKLNLEPGKFNYPKYLHEFIEL